MELFVGIVYLLSLSRKRYMNQGRCIKKDILWVYILKPTPLCNATSYIVPCLEKPAFILCFSVCALSLSVRDVFYLESSDFLPRKWRLNVFSKCLCPFTSSTISDLLTQEDLFCYISVRNVLVFVNERDILSFGPFLQILHVTLN